MSLSESQTTKTPQPKNRGSIITLVVFLVIGIGAAVGAFFGVRKLVSTWDITDLGGTNPIPEESAETVDGTPSAGTDDTTTSASSVTSDIESLPEPWDGVSRVTVLLLGLDYEDTEERRTAPRSDTMILFTMDPLSMTAGILTIPRDMWVNIPGYGYNRINTAYRLGELDKLPGGGPGLAMETVEAFIGVPIQYYAQVDFYAFTEFIDSINGITVNVPYQLKVDPLGEGNTVILEPGEQLLGGAVALAYARNRYTEGSDFDRSERQMQVIMAIRDKIVDLNMLPTLVQNAPDIYDKLSDGIHTNLTLDQVIQLALLAKDIPRDSIIRRTIGEDEITFGTSDEGEKILKPLSDQIRVLRDEVFTTGGPLTPAATGDDSASLMKAEAASVIVKNGSSTPGLGGTTTDYLNSLGVSTVEPSDAGETISVTRIYDYTGNPYTVKYLVDLMGIQSTQIFTRYDPTSTVDVEIDLGNDWAYTNTMP